MNCSSHRFSGNGTSASEEHRISQARKWVEGQKETMRKSRVAMGADLVLLEMEGHYNAILDTFDRAEEAEAESKRLEAENKRLKARLQEVGAVGSQSRLLKGELNMMRTTVRAAIGQLRKMARDHEHGVTVDALDSFLNKLEVCISGQEGRR